MKFFTSIFILVASGLANAQYQSEDYVICSFPKNKLVSFVQTGAFKPRSLAAEGFVHCCRPSQLTYVMRKFFVEDEHILLISSKEKLGAKLIYEGNRSFPHLYREFRAEDLIDIIFVKREESGEFSVPKEFI